MSVPTLGAEHNCKVHSAPDQSTLLASMTEVSVDHHTVPTASRVQWWRASADDSAPTPNANVSPAVAAAHAAAAAATKYSTPAPQPFGHGLSRAPVRLASMRKPVAAHMHSFCFVAASPQSVCLTKHLACSPAQLA